MRTVRQAVTNRAPYFCRRSNKDRDMKVLEILLTALAAMSLTWFIPSFVLLHFYKRINTTSEKIIEIKDQLIARNEREIAELKSDLTLAVETPDLIRDFKHTKETLEIYKGFLDEEHRKRRRIEKAFVELGGDMDSLREQSK